ncbi:MAG: hypothetical protein V4655_07990, partial [Bdellovibrionota bacterium]
MPRAIHPCILIVLFSLAISSCSSSGSKSSDPSGGIKPKTALSDLSSTRLVRYDEAKRWPHLQRHIGQLLLMNQTTQIILASAPPLANTQSHFLLISRVYRLQGQEWQALKSLPSIEIHLESKASEPLQLIGQDITDEQGQEAVVAFFRQNKSGSEDARLILSIAKDQAKMNVKIENADPELRFSVRIGKGLNEDHLIPLTSKTVAGLSNSLLPEAMAVVGFRPFTAQATDSANELFADPQSPGFALLLGRDALLNQAELLNTLNPCYLTPSETAENCLKLAMTPRDPKALLWKLEAPRLKKNEQAIWQSAMIYTKQGSFRSLIPIKEGETLELPLAFASSAKWEILTADDQGILQKNAIPSKQSPVIKLPKISKGSLLVRTDRPQPRFVEIKSAMQKHGKSLLAWVSPSEFTLVSPHTLLQTKWPLSLTFPSGDYSLKIYDGFRILCEQQFTLLKGRKNIMECNEPPLVPAFSTRASISYDKRNVIDSWRLASSISLMTSSDLKSPNKDYEIPMLAAYDQELGLWVRAFPSTPELEKAWTALIKTSPEKNNLNTFTEFVRGQTKDAQIVLDCPHSGFPIAEYQWIAQSIKADIIDIFGCGSPERAKDFFQMAAKLQKQKDQPLKFSAASFSDSRYGTRVPAIYLSRYKHLAVTHKTVLIDPKLVVDDLRSGRYTLGFRTEIGLPSVKRSDKVVSVKVRTSDSVPRKIIVRIHDETDRLNELEVTQEKRESTFDIPLVLRPGSRFLRIEVLGRDMPEDPLFTLATSNYFRLD